MGESSDGHTRHHGRLRVLWNQSQHRNYLGTTGVNGRKF
nr:MAG TPA: hypothetical protein [Caudoviricetes sp.]